MARKRKRNEDNTPAAPEEQPEEEDELEEEGGVDPGAGGGAARLKLEATRKRKREYMQRKRARDGDEEKAKSKLAMHNFRSGLSGQAKADYLARQNQYKAVYRQRKTEGVGPAPRGRRIDDDSEQEDEPEDEGAEERSPVHQLTSGSSPPPPPASSRAPKKTKSAASSSRANPPPKARRSKKTAKVRGKRKASAKGDMPDAPTTEEETKHHPPPKLTRSLRERPAPSQPTSPAPSQPASRAPSQPAALAPSQPASPAPSQPAAPASSTSQRTTPKKRKYHTVLCARGARCVLGDGGRIPIDMHGPKRFTFRKWVSRHGNPFVTAQGKPVDEATFNAAMVTCCAKDLVHYRLKLIERAHEPGILDAYLTDDEGPEQEEWSEEEQNAGGINLDPDGFTPLPYLLPSNSPAPFGLQGMKEEDWNSDGFFDPEEPPRALTPPKAFDSIIPTLASRAATPTLGDIYTRPSRSPSPFPVSPEHNTLAPLLDYGTPEAEEVLDYGTPEEELEDGEQEEAARLAKLRLKVHAAALQAFRGSVQYNQRFDPLLYKPTAPTNLDIYDHNVGEQRSTVEILQIKQEMAEGFEEGASGVVSAPSSAMDPLPEGWWDLPQMPWTPQDYAEREQKAKDGTWRRAFNSGIFFVTGVHVSRRDARAATVAARID
ncbi:hypothetical protein C8F04DRAFT_1189241 [Mycena alexandri]|uniref:Uncharacterized protein n=1 Tax=Mycena alexandri TaxID=1745969 RepID=A0AAD6WYA0_9AGAR|nr:hypothetical protein C8F04DRAFT_1189241 [Mycena alexandri]